MKLNIITLALIVVFAVTYLLHMSQLAWTPVRVIGLAIATPALLLLILARIQLGRAFSVSPKASTLVKAGLYSRIRNPIYVFGSLFIIGIIISTGRLWLLLILVIIVPMQIIRSRKEAQVLEAKFGAEYLDYKRNTWF